MKSNLISIFSASLFLAASSAWGCPALGGLIDYNCDQSFKIAATGDSIVRGVGDEINDGDGGYVSRLRKILGLGKIENLGVPGITSQRLYRTLKKNLRKKKGQTAIESQDADIYLLAVGVNDYFLRQSAGLTVRNIARIVKVIRKGVARSSNSAPYVVVASLVHTAREFQEPFVEQVNELLLKHVSKKLPVYLHFESLDTALLNDDGLHPTSAGYDALAAIVGDYIEEPLQRKMAAQRKDRDKDGVYDFFEKRLFETDPRSEDSDSDGLSDGSELFEHNTNPNKSDTDGDGVSDFDEILDGSDPLVAEKQEPHEP